MIESPSTSALGVGEMDQRRFDAKLTCLAVGQTAAMAATAAM